MKGKGNEIRERGSIFVVIVATLLLFQFPDVSAAPLPPSEHVLSYEDFVSSNAYAGEFITVNAKIKRIETSKELDWYLSLIHI